MDRTAHSVPLQTLAPREGLNQIKRLLPDGELLSCPLLRERRALFLTEPLLLFFFFAPFRKFYRVAQFLMLRFNSICFEVFSFFAVTKCLIFVLLILNSAARAVVKLIQHEIHIIHHSISAIRTYLIERANIQLNIHFFFFWVSVLCS